MHVVERDIPNELIIQKHRMQMNNKYPPPQNKHTKHKTSVFETMVSLIVQNTMYRNMYQTAGNSNI